MSPLFPSTQIQVVSATHQPLARASCGTEGFRNAKKSTGIAAQTAGIAAAAVSTHALWFHLCVPLFALLITAEDSPWPFRSNEVFATLLDTLTLQVA